MSFTPDTNTRRVLFLCPHGAAKSVIAVALFNRAATQRGLDAVAFNAGTEPDPEVPARVIALLTEAQLAVPAGAPRAVTNADIAGAHCVVSMGCALTDLPAQPAVWLDWGDVPAVSADPARAFAVIGEKVNALITTLR
jgi:arsenate reductase (thioredoxin)